MRRPYSETIISRRRSSGFEEFVDRTKGLLKGDRREQTSLRQARAKVLSWNEITQAVEKAWGTDWEMAKEAHRSGARGAALLCESSLLGPLVAGAGPIGPRGGISRRDLPIRRFEKRLQVDKKFANRLNHVLKTL
jgi:hypothetical protein